MLVSLDIETMSLISFGDPISAVPLDLAKVCESSTLSPTVAGPAGIVPGLDTEVVAAVVFSARAFISLNFLYVVVLGIVSDKNSRLSMRDTALAAEH